MNVCGLMFDSTTPAMIPSWAKLRALYINGIYRQVPSYAKGHVYIDVLGNMPGAAGILDVETGDATADQVPGWLTSRLAKTGEIGTVYCNESTLPAVQAAAGYVPFSIWLATLDGSMPLNPPPDLVAVQAFGGDIVGVNLDISVVVDQGWWNQHAL